MAQLQAAADALPLMTRLLEQAVERDEAARQSAATEMASMRVEIAELREALTPQGAISDQQLSALQQRLEGMHAAKLLSDDEMFALEDLCADYVELQSSVGVVVKEMTSLHKLVALSEKLAGDSAFARQARRKFT